MQRSDVEHFGDETPRATDDTAPIGGEIDTDEPIADEAEDGLFADLPGIPTTGEGNAVIYEAGWLRIKPSATGTLANPRVYNRAGARPNASGGVIQVVCGGPCTGTVRGTGKETAPQDTWDQDDVVCTGTTPASGDQTFAANTLKRYEYLEGGVPAKPPYPITISVNGQVTAVIYGTGTPSGSDPGRGNIMATDEYRLAIATDVDAVIGWSDDCNRRTAPDENVGAFGYAHRWAGGDASLAVASDMTAGSKINYCAELTVFENIPRPVGGYLVLDVDLLGENDD